MLGGCLSGNSRSKSHQVSPVTDKGELNKDDTNEHPKSLERSPHRNYRQLRNAGSQRGGFPQRREH